MKEIDEQLKNQVSDRIEDHVRLFLAIFKNKLSYAVSPTCIMALWGNLVRFLDGSSLIKTSTNVFPVCFYYLLAAGGEIEI